MKTAIVILNWNGRKLLERFLPAVVAHSSHLAEVYVADNASTDDSVAYVQKHFDTVTVVQNLENGGYAKGYNDALKHITADLYVLLNSDILVADGWLEPMINIFKDENVGAAQPKIKDLNNPEYFEYAGAAGGYLDRFAYPFCRGRIFDHCEKDTGQYNNTVNVQWASGACLFVRSTCYWEAGALDETYFAHQEEIDLCWRIKNIGHNILASGVAEVLHLGGGTLATGTPKKTFYNFRNSLFNIVKNVKGFKWLFIVIFRLLLDGIAALKYVAAGKPQHLVAILKAHVSFYAHIPSLLSKRKSRRQSADYAIIPSIVWSYYVSKKRAFVNVKK